MPDSVYESILALAAERLLELRLIKQINVPAPTAGSEAIITVPGGVVYELLSFTGTLTASAAVANRIVSIQVTDPDNNRIQRFYSSRTLVANGAANYTFAAGYGDHETNSGTNDSLPCPPTAVTSGSKIQTLVSGIDVADQWTVTSFLVRQWSESDIQQETEVITDQISSLYGREVTGR